MKSTKKTQEITAKAAAIPPAARNARSPIAAGRVRVVATLREAGRPLNFDELADRGSAATARRRAAACKRSSMSCCTPARSSAIAATNTACASGCRSSSARCSGHRDGHGFVLPDDRSAPVFLRRAQMLRNHARRPRRGAHQRHRTTAAGRKARSSRCSSATRARSSAACTRSPASASWCPTIRASAIACSCRADISAARAPARSCWSSWSSSRRARRRRWAT